MTKTDKIMEQVDMYTDSILRSTINPNLRGVILNDKTKLRAMIEDAMKVPDGWKIVPIEPDELSIQAGCLEHSDNYYKSYKKWTDSHSSGIVNRLRNLVICGYKAMISAAPECEDKPCK
jgi:hypothetical protein